MIKAILFDADGVTLKKQGYFSEIYSKEYGVPGDKILPFFKNEYRECQLGKIDIKEVLPKYLDEWGWQKSIDDFLKYWFQNNTVANDQVVNKIQGIRAKGVKCYLVTDQEKYRAEYTRESLGFKNKFDDCFFSCEIGHSKSEPNFFRIVLAQLKINPDEVMYFDDEQENIDAAKQLDIQIKLYTNLSDLNNIGR